MRFTQLHTLPILYLGQGNQLEGGIQMRLVFILKLRSLKWDQGYEMENNKNLEKKITQLESRIEMLEEKTHPSEIRKIAHS